MNWAYLLRCADGTLYAGWTTDVNARVEAHNGGKGAKYTRGRTPVRLAWAQEFSTKQEAMQKEAALKRMPKMEKEALVRAFEVSGRKSK